MALNAGYRRQLFLPLGGLFTHVVQKASPLFLNSSCSTQSELPSPSSTACLCLQWKLPYNKICKPYQKVYESCCAYFLCVVPDPQKIKQLFLELFVCVCELEILGAFCVLGRRRGMHCFARSSFMVVVVVVVRAKIRPGHIPSSFC